MAGMDNTEPDTAPDTLSAQAAALGPTPLEKPYTVEEAIEVAGPDGVLVAIVEIPLADLFAARGREDAGEEGMIARRIVENRPHRSNWSSSASAPATGVR